VATDLLEATAQSAGPDSDGAEGPSDGGGRDQLSSAVQHQPNDNDARDSQVRLRLLAPEVTCSTNYTSSASWFARHKTPQLILTNVCATSLLLFSLTSVCGISGLWQSASSGIYDVCSYTPFSSTRDETTSAVPSMGYSCPLKSNTKTNADTPLVPESRTSNSAFVVSNENNIAPHAFPPNRSPEAHTSTDTTIPTANSASTSPPGPVSDCQGTRPRRDLSVCSWNIRGL
jgi:hypothetical protein